MDEGPQGNAPPQGAPSGNGAAPDSAPAVDAVRPSTDGESAPTTQATVDLDGLYRRAYGEGAKRAENRLLKNFGAESWDEVKDFIERGRASEAPQKESDEGAQQARDYQKAYRELQTEHGQFRRKYESLEQQAQRLAVQSQRALRAEVRSRLLQNGAHPEAVDDLAGLVEQQLDWSEDGTAIEVVEVVDGHRQPARVSFDELLGTLPDAKPWFFATKVPAGAGSSVDSGQRPTGTAPPSDSYDFRERFDEHQRRRR